jgi:hypothetical protein
MTTSPITNEDLRKRAEEILLRKRVLLARVSKASPFWLDQVRGHVRELQATVTGEPQRRPYMVMYQTVGTGKSANVAASEDDRLRYLVEALSAWEKSP